MTTDRAAARLQGLRVTLTTLDALERETNPLSRPMVAHTVGLVVGRIEELEEEVGDGE